MSRILKKASRSKLNKSDDKKGFWEYADYLFPPPRNISWKYFPMDHVFSGKWYKDEVFRFELNSCLNTVICLMQIIFLGKISMKACGQYTQIGLLDQVKKKR